MTISIDGAEVSMEECCKRAEAGDADAQNQLGLELEESDPFQAAKWLKKSAESGHKNAQCNLAAYYEDGIGVPRDFVLAYMWYSLSIDNGVSWAPDRRDSLENKMSRDEVLEAQKLARARY